MATRRQPSRVQQDQSTPQRLSLLKHLITSSLPSSPLTALFFAERLLALDSSREESVYLVALCLSRIAAAAGGSSRYQEAIWLLRQPVSCHPNLDPDHPPTRKYTSAKQQTKPAFETTLRCARLYAASCLAVGRAREGREALAKAMSTTTPLPISTDQAPDLSHSTVFHPETEPWVNDLELARLARKAGEHERAIVSYRKVLEAHPWCWEALEGLCSEGAPPDPDVLFPPRPLRASTSSVPISPMPAHAKPLVLPSHPPPLGPSQTSAVNSSLPFSKARGAGGGGNLGPSSAMMEPSSGWSTVGETPSGYVQPYAMVGAGVRNGKGVDGGKGFFAAGGGQTAFFKRTGAGAQGGKGLDMMDTSMDDSSFEVSFYPNAQQAPPPFSYLAMPGHASTVSVLPPAFSNAHASGSASLFTPPPLSNPTVVAPGVKRARGQQPPVASTSATGLLEEEAKAGRRVVKGVPSTTAAERKRDGSVGAPTRRSSRLSSAPSAMGPTSTSMAMARSTSSRTAALNAAAANSNILGGPRDKKRTKNGTGPSVLSDAGSDIISPQSRSSSADPASPGGHHTAVVQVPTVDPAALEAEDYVANTLRCFGRAAVNSALYKSSLAIEALMALPVEQQRTWRCLLGLGKAHMEMLNYDKAEKAFLQARQNAPHLLESMEMYSTLLWHMRLPTQLSYLAQDLMTIAPRDPCAWIAAGNVFSHLEDHASALKCFKRAAQLDPSCVYAYTLSGHECVVLDEWERALGFFREAVKLDPRHYNAWFGMGNAYMQIGKYRLAEYHFRKASEINPTNAALVCCVGTVVEKLGDRKEALKLYERAVILAPESPAVRFKRVKILIAMKQYPEAERDLLSLKDRAPNEFNVYFLLGKLYKILGKKADMLKYFGLAQDLEPRTASIIRDTIDADKVAMREGMEVDHGDASMSTI